MDTSAKKGLLFAGLVLTVSLLPVVPSHAQVTPTDEYSKLITAGQHIQAVGARPFGENVNLYDGSLSFEVTDVSAPGIGPTLQLGRVLHAAEGSSDSDPNFQRPFGDWDLDVPRIETNSAHQTNVSGWQILSNGTAGALDRCTDFNLPPPVVSSSPPDGPWDAVRWWYGYHLIVPGYGNQLLLQRSSNNTHTPASGSYPIVTKRDWMVACGVTASDGGEGFLAVAPDGTRYTFAHLVYWAMPGVQRPNGSTGNATSGVHPLKSDVDNLERRDAVMYVTQVEDRFGNTLTYNWSSSDPNNLVSIVASDGRELDLSYSAGSELINTVTLKAAGGASTRTWTYNYGGNAVLPTLTSVQLPDGSAWSYQMGNLESANLNTAGGSCLQNTLPMLQSTAASGSMTSPSGLAATFTVTPTLHGRSYVPKACWSPYANSTVTYANIPDEYYQFSVTKEVISGPGTPTATWTWSYSTPNQSWTSDSCASNNTCATTVYTDVTDPLGQDVRYTFSNRFDYTEGQLLRTDAYSGAVGSTDLRSVVNTYANSTGNPWPGSYGTSLQTRINFAQTEGVSPLLTSTESQQGATFTTSVNTFDSYARATSTTKSSSLGDSKTDTTTYTDDASNWVLGLVTQTATNGIASSQTTYNSADQPYQQYAFGKLVSTKTWNGNGTLATDTDGDNNKTTFSNWYRGLPQSITFADGTSKSATVNGNGWITALTDENGFTTNYGYDAMGRLASITYPAGDDVAWNPTLLSFTQVSGSELGIPGGHWKQTVTTGNDDAVTYFDAFWRPLVTEHYDAGNPSGTLSQVVHQYDADGRNVFTSYLVRSVTSYTQSVPGTHTSYDALNRVTQVQQDSELGTLTTSEQYLSGFETEVTDPRGYNTVTSYQAYGEPTTQWPVSITAPQGELTVIMRDAFGKPLSVTRTGTASGSPQVTRSYVYDGYQQLCKRIEPETGATAFGYDGAGNLAWSAEGLNLPGTTTCDASAAQGSGQVVSRTYDTRNRIKSLSFPDGNGNQSWTYYADGLPSTITRQNDNGTNALVTNSYLYDKRRLLTSEALAETSEPTWTLGYGHDANGHLASEVYPVASP